MDDALPTYTNLAVGFHFFVAGMCTLIATVILQACGVRRGKQERIQMAEHDYMEHKRLLEEATLLTSQHDHVQILLTVKQFLLLG
jgi:predicted metal-binding transcription factor (methanogenesis marker protein 9)